MKSLTFILLPLLLLFLRLEPVHPSRQDFFSSDNPDNFTRNIELGAIKKKPEATIPHEEDADKERAESAELMRKLLSNPWDVCLELIILNAGRLLTFKRIHIPADLAFKQTKNLLMLHLKPMDLIHRLVQRLVIPTQLIFPLCTSSKDAGYTEIEDILERHPPLPWESYAEKPSPWTIRFSEEYDSFIRAVEGHPALAQYVRPTFEQDLSYIYPRALGHKNPRVSKQLLYFSASGRYLAHLIPLSNIPFTLSKRPMFEGIRESFLKFRKMIMTQIDYERFSLVFSKSFSRRPMFLIAAIHDVMTALRVMYLAQIPINTEDIYVAAMAGEYQDLVATLKMSLAQRQFQITSEEFLEMLRVVESENPRFGEVLRSFMQALSEQ